MEKWPTNGSYDTSNVAMAITRRTSNGRIAPCDGLMEPTGWNNYEDVQ